MKTLRIFTLSMDRVQYWYQMFKKVKERLLWRYRNIPECEILKNGLDNKLEVGGYRKFWLMK